MKAIGDGASKHEQHWDGIAVSDGVAAGRVLRLHDGARSLFRTTLAAGEVAPEVERLRRAIHAAHEQLAAIKERAERQLGTEHAYIFDAHLAMIEDRKLVEDIETCIRREQVNAEWAVKVVTDHLLGVYAEFTDDYLRERGSDIEDVARRILTALGGAPHVKRQITEDAVIVAEELLPSTLAELDFARVRAIVSDVGGWTSHSAIIARGLGIPAIVGVRDFYRSARTGNSVIVDATRGRVTLHPSAAELQRFDFASTHAHASTATPHKLLREPLYTLDGEQVFLRANVELPAEYAGVASFGAHGIGLYRSEFLWSQHNRMPTEEEQYAAYAEVVRVAGQGGATIRLFDFGGDKFALEGLEPERNPALGLRAIRLGLRHEEILRTQASALLRVAHTAPGLGIVLPMVADAGDVRRARAVIEAERARLVEQGTSVGEVRIGAMIEVPSAALTIERITAEVDFLSLGTNDLVQYTLAVDRGNDAVAEWFRSLHPAVLTSIRRTLEAARAASLPAIVCGEMAAAPAYAFVLVGLGARDLSMSASSIPRIRRMISQVNTVQARGIADACLECATAGEVEELVRVRLGAELPQLFTPDMLPTPMEQ